MIEILRKLIHLIYHFSPKWNYAVIWGWPDYEDSVISLEKALQSSQVKKVILLMTDSRTAPTWEHGPKTICIKKNSPGGWLLFCFAKYVFFTHRCFMRKFPPNVVAVNIWHGMPIKKIGWMLEEGKGICAQYTVATSPFWARIMTQAMRPEGNVLVSGLPRNDRMFSDRDSVFNKLGLSKNIKLLAWLPTYRRSVRGDLRIDGVEADNVFEMPDLNPQVLNEFLKSHGAFLIIKPHPMANSSGYSSLSNLLIIDDHWLRQRMLSLYELLGATSLLISDISSVVIDYLLLDRPIIHAFTDCENYKLSRGFSVEPIEDYFMGPIVKNAQELEATLSEILSGNDIDSEKRQSILKLSHVNVDNKSTERLLRALNLI